MLGAPGGTSALSADPSPNLQSISQARIRLREHCTACIRCLSVDRFHLAARHVGPKILTDPASSRIANKLTCRFIAFK